MIQLQESKELGVFKLLLTKFGEYAEKYPLSGIMKHLDMALANGKKVCPKDEKAKEIIELVLHNGSASEAIQYLLNRRFCDLPALNQPFYKDGNKRVVAFWCKKEGVVSDRIKDLLNLDGEASGYWCDLEGKKISVEKA